MLHLCIEGEKVGVNGCKIVDVDRRPDHCPIGVLAPPGERGREPPPPSSSSLAPPLDVRRVPPLVHGLHGAEEQEPLRDWISLSVLFCFAPPRSGRKPFLIFREIRNSDYAEILT